MVPRSLFVLRIATVPARKMTDQTARSAVLMLMKS
jgi:hypothetical protein